MSRVDNLFFAQPAITYVDIVIYILMCVQMGVKCLLVLITSVLIQKHNAEEIILIFRGMK